MDVLKGVTVLGEFAHDVKWLKHVTSSFVKLEKTEEKNKVEKVVQFSNTESEKTTAPDYVKLVDNIITQELPFPKEFDERSIEERVKARQHELVRCIKCSFKAPSNKLGSLLEHIRQKHGHEALVKFRTKKSTVLTLQCPDCQYCFTKQSAIDAHKVKRDQKGRTRCEVNAKYTRKLRQTEKQARREKLKATEERLHKLTFRCPLKKCPAVFHRVTDIVKHVKVSHSPAEFLVFMTGDEFLDFIGKKCQQCGFLHQTVEVHSREICSHYQQLRLKHEVSHFEFRFVRSRMVDGGLLLKTQSDIDSALSSDQVEEKPKKRRKKRKRGSDSAIKLDSDGSDDSEEEVSQVVAIPRNSIYHRCPVAQCTFKTLRSDDKTDWRAVTDHMETQHNTEYVVFKRTRFSATGFQCSVCGFWYRDKSELDDHLVMDCAVNQTYPPFNYTLLELFDLSILSLDYDLEYRAIPRPSPQPFSVAVNSFWSKCPFFGCTGIETIEGEDMIKTRQRALEHLSKHGDVVKTRVLTASLENESQVVPRRCHKCNWVLFGGGGHPDCDSVLQKVARFRAEGSWEAVSLKPSFRLARIQAVLDLESLGRLKITEKANRSLDCVGCGQTFKTLSDLDSHVDSEHSLVVWATHNRRVTNLRPYCCPLCGFTFESEEEAQLHSQAKHCEFNLMLPYPILIMTPKMTRLTRKELRTASNLEDAVRMKSRHKRTLAAVVNNTGGSSFPCFECEKEYDTNKAFENHLRLRHGTKSWVKYRALESNLFPYRCPSCHLCQPSTDHRHECGRYLSWVEESGLDLTNHQELGRIRSELHFALTWACPVCDEEFPVSQCRLYRHILKEHGVQQWGEFRSQPIPGLHEEKCKDCRIYFRSSIRHDCTEYRRKLDQLGRTDLLPCPVCKEEFSIVHFNQLYNHISARHGVLAMIRYRSKPIPGFQEYQCPDCHVYCARPPFPKNLSHRDCDHILEHTQKCNIEIRLDKQAIGKTYESKNRLEKPNFTLKDEMTTDTQSEVEDFSEPTSRSPRNRKPAKSIKCPICDRDMASSNISRHLRQVHKDSYDLIRKSILPGYHEAFCRTCNTSLCHKYTTHRCMEDKNEIDWPPNVLNRDDEEYYKKMGDMVKCKYCTSFSVYCPSTLMNDHIAKRHPKKLQPVLGLTEAHEANSSKLEKPDVKLERSETSTSTVESPKCPKCSVPFSNYKDRHSVLGHLRYCLPPKKWLEYRRSFIAGFQEIKCPKCNFYFADKRLHKCSTLLELAAKIEVNDEVQDVGADKKEANADRPSVQETTVDQSHTQNTLNGPTDEETVTKDGLYRCVICVKTFKTQIAFTGHTHSFHNEEERVKIKQYKIPGFLDHQCSNCKLFFATDPASNHHKCKRAIELVSSGVLDAIKLGEPRHIIAKCRLCKASFTRRSRFILHLKNKHTDYEKLKLRTKPVPYVYEKQCPKCEIYLFNQQSQHNCQEFIDFKKTYDPDLNKTTDDETNAFEASPKKPEPMVKPEFTTYDCLLCNAEVSRARMLHHLKTKHTSKELITVLSKPIYHFTAKCKKCGLFFGMHRGSQEANVHNCSKYQALIAELAFKDSALASLEQAAERVDALKSSATDTETLMLKSNEPSSSGGNKTITDRLETTINHSKRPCEQSNNDEIPITKTLDSSNDGYFTADEFQKESIVPTKYRHDMPRSCPVCQKMIKQKNINQHMRTHTPSEQVKARSSPFEDYWIVKCQGCGLYVGATKANKEIASKHDCAYLKSLVDQVNPRRDDIEQKETEHHTSEECKVNSQNDVRNLKCPKCLVDFETLEKQRVRFGRKGVLEHLRRCLPPKEWLSFRRSYVAGFQEEQCSKCKFYFPHKVGVHQCRRNVALALGIEAGETEKIDDDQEPDNQEDEFEDYTPAIKKARFSTVDYKESDSPKGEDFDLLCTLCGDRSETYPSKEELDAHIAESHNENEYINDGESLQIKNFSESSSTKVFGCPECNVSLKRSKLFRHIRKKHGETAYLKLRTTVIKNVQQYRCGACYFVFSQGIKPGHQCEQYSKLTEHMNLSSIDHIGELDESGKVVYLAKDVVAHAKLEKELDIHCGECSDDNDETKDHYCPFYTRRQRLNPTSSIGAPDNNDEVCSKEPADNNFLAILETSVDDRTMFKCSVKYCPILFENRKTLQSHVRTSHSADDYAKFKMTVIPGVQEEVCPKCKCVVADLRRHWSSVCNQNIHFLQKHSADSSALAIEPPEDPKMTHTCHICGNNMKNLMSLICHYKTKHTLSGYIEFRETRIAGSRDVKCNDCRGFYRGPKNTQYHSSYHCRQLNEFREKARLEQNQVLPIASPPKEELKKSVVIKIAPEQYEKEVSTSAEETKTKQETQAAKVTSPKQPEPTEVACPVCKQKFSATSGLYSHYKQKHGDTEYLKFRRKFIAGLQEHYCSVCTFYTKNKSHECQKFQEVVRKIEEQSPEKKKLRDIDVGLERFMESHAECMHPTECPECREVLPNVQKLYWHLANDHTQTEFIQYRAKMVAEVQEWRCPQCLVYFPGEYEHACEEVKKILTCSDSSGDIEAVEHCLCPYCPVTMSKGVVSWDVSFRYDDLVTHIKKKHADLYHVFRMTDSPIQPFKCDECGFYFHTKELRKKHLERRQCKKNKQTLNEVMKQQEKTLAITECAKVPSLPVGVERKENRLFACSVCNLMFPSFCKMDEHFRSEHDREAYVTYRRAECDDKEKCGECGFTFPTKEDLFNHYTFCNEYKLTSTGDGISESISKRKHRRSSGREISPKRRRSSSVPTVEPDSSKSSIAFQKPIADIDDKKQPVNILPSNSSNNSLGFITINDVKYRVLGAPQLVLAAQPVQIVKLPQAISVVNQTENIDQTENVENDELISDDGLTVEELSSDGGQEETTLALNQATVEQATTSKSTTAACQSQKVVTLESSDDDIVFVSASTVSLATKVEEDPPFDSQLHRKATTDQKFECFMQNCSKVDVFSRIITHLREGTS